MIDYELLEKSVLRKKADALVLPFWEKPKAAFPDEKEILSQLDLDDFSGKMGEIALFYLKGKDKRVIALGLGPEKKGDEPLRKAVSSLVKFCDQKHFSHINFLAHEHAEIFWEGIGLSSYRFDRWQTEKKEEKLKKVTFITGKKLKKERFDQIESLVSCVNFARELINDNADDITPQHLADRAKNIHPKVKTTILDKKQLQKEKLGLLLAVGRAAEIEPRLILMEYKGNPSSSDWTAIVGKGVTYDTGGLNLKPTGSMETMRCDMSGAATVLATCKAAALLGLKVNLVGVIPTAENAISSKSYKPGDVYVGYSGKTVEIANTDAEGRLILADAVAYVQEKYKLSRLIDLATLTGAIIIALGEDLTGLFCNNDKLAEKLSHAGETVHERLWRMPLLDEYKDLLKSKIADIKNSGGKSGSSITAALFIGAFIKEGLPWAHLDIAGTAFLSDPKYYNSTPATGVGVRLLIEFLRKL